jgi:uncharacterized protein
VNYVGVDLNTASPSLLRYISGLNQLTARRVYDHRQANGPFKSREQLKEVSGFGDATFVQAAGFLKITDGENALDTTWIHPESYEVAGRVLEKLGFGVADLSRKEVLTDLAAKAATLDADALAAELQVGKLLLQDILAQFTRPGRDPREDLPSPIFKRGVLKLEDLAVGMELAGSVLNVVDFGAFVDIGLHDSGLVHISHMANRYVQDPHEVASVGDIVKVWVLQIDKDRRRVSLTMIPPGSRRGEGPKRPEGQPPRESRPPRGQRPPRPSRPQQQPQAQAAGDGQTAAVAASAGAGPRTVRPPQHGGRRSQGNRQQGNRQQGNRSQGNRPSQPPHFQPKPKPKPLVPITEEMKKGKEPMRTFGDLKQFFEIKPEEPKSEEPAPPV